MGPLTGREGGRREERGREGGREGGEVGREGGRGREKYSYITQIMTDSGGRTVLHRERNTHM